jgi:NAD(P)-dependent dehydrogenase (short-subunit alcohol dehydrogenase family)
MTPVTHHGTGTVLLIGASRGLGLAMAGELASRGWHVVATVRGTVRTALHDLADRHDGRVAIEDLDITRPDEIAALHDRLAGRAFDILFVNAGTAGPEDDTAATIRDDAFAHVLLTNALGPMRVIEGLQDLVAPDGLIGVMSSGQGSIANNNNGLREVYRSSKSALNQLMRSYAARRAGGGRALLLMAPGWVRTDLGGPDAPFGIEETIPKVIDVIVGRWGVPGLNYLDRDGKTVPW